jgi:hypothetical protein
VQKPPNTPPSHPNTSTVRHSGYWPPSKLGGNVIASRIAGLLYTVASPAVAFGYAAACMALALAALA